MSLSSEGLQTLGPNTCSHQQPCEREHKCVLFVLVGICLRHRALCLSLSLSFTSDVEQFMFLCHLCFSSFSSPCFSLSLLIHCLCACRYSQGVGVSRSLLPASLFEHMSTGQVFHPPTQWTTLCVNPCSRAHLGLCATAQEPPPKRLGCLHWPAHAAGHGHV